MRSEDQRPGPALFNLLDRDRMFTSRLRDEVMRLGMHLIEVNTAMSQDDLTEQMEGAFGL